MVFNDSSIRRVDIQTFEIKKSIDVTKLLTQRGIQQPNIQTMKPSYSTFYGKGGSRQDNHNNNATYGKVAEPTQDMSI